METIANYLGNYKRQATDGRPELYSPGPIIISSNFYYAWGDLLTFRHIGETIQSLPINEGGLLHQPIGEYIPLDGTAPIHLRYHTISEENPVTIIQNIGHGDENVTEAIIVLKSTPMIKADGYNNFKYIEIEDHSDKEIEVDVFINMVESSEQVGEEWAPTKERRFLLSMEPLLMFVMKLRANPAKAVVMIIEASPSYDQNLPNPSDISLETFVQHFVDQVVESVVAAASTNN